MNKMKALNVLYGGRLGNEAFERLFPGDNSAFSLALAASRRFSGAAKTIFFGLEGDERPSLPPDVEAVYRPAWTNKSLLEELSRVSAGYDFLYYAWADCPFLDPALAASLAERHTRYGAEYSYADGWPYGYAPELLSHEAAGVLARLIEQFPASENGAVERDALFQIIQKDINAFDIETEISPVDLRPYRLNLAADSKRNLLLLSRINHAGLNSASEIEKIASEKPEPAHSALLRTLPAFFNIQISGTCPQSCSFCPWPLYGGADIPVTERKDFMSRAAFEQLLDKISGFAGDGVISFSLWGEPALHPEKMELIEMVLKRPALSLIIETSGIGWKNEELQTLSRLAAQAAPRINRMAPLSWVVSLDAHDAERYKAIRGSGFPEAQACAKMLLELFPKDTYVQALRIKDFEDDIEHFYRFWKEKAPQQLLSAGRNDGSHIIIQKYDDFAGALPKLQASDLSPVKRRPCWHIQRDMNILLDGRVPCCREDLAVFKGGEVWGNVFTEDISQVWEKGEFIYQEHTRKEYRGICSNCDEYYTFNF